MMQAMARRMLLGKAGRALRTWIEWKRENERRAVTTATVALRWSRMGESRAIRQWRDWAMARMETREHMRAIIRRMRAGRMGAAWRQLREHAQEQAARRGLMRQCASRWANQGLSRALDKLRARA